MSAIFALMVLTVIIPTSGRQDEPYTYWVDESCRRHGARFEDALKDALATARRGHERMVSEEDRVMSGYFATLFTPPQDAFYRLRVDDVLEILGGDRQISDIPANFGPGISQIIQEPNNNLKEANYRFYCDNDIQDASLNSNSRWRLRKDPSLCLGCVPISYQRQRDRPHWNDATVDQRQRGQYQEWEDVENGMVMSGTAGCQDRERQLRAVTYLAQARGRSSWGNKSLRATVTLCDVVYDQDEPRTWNLDNLQDTDFTQLRPGEEAIENFKVLISMSLLHEMFHLPPWSRSDEESPYDANERAYLWTDCQRLTIDRRFRNVNNYYFFCLLARLADRGWRLSNEAISAFEGDLERDDSIIPS